MNEISVLIKPSSSMCNLHCKYCFYHDVANNREFANKGFMTDDVIENIIEKTFELKPKRISYFFQGGEPTLIGIDFYKRFIDKVNKKNINNILINYAIQTNATLLNNEWYKLFKDNNFLVGISLDGVKETHNYLRSDTIGSYKNITSKIKQLEKEKIEYNVLVVVTKKIALHPVAVYNNLKKEGIKYLQFIPCLDNFDKSLKEYSLSINDYGYFLVTLFKLWKKDLESNNYISIRLFDNIIRRLNNQNVELCSFNGKCSCQFVIEANGDVYPCDFYCIDKYLLGNIKTSTFKDLFMSNNCVSFLNEGSIVKEKCKDCKYYFLCKGGCRRENEKENFCESYKKLYEEIYKN